MPKINDTTTVPRRWSNVGKRQILMCPVCKDCVLQYETDVSYKGHICQHINAEPIVFVESKQ